MCLHQYITIPIKGSKVHSLTNWKVHAPQNQKQQYRQHLWYSSLLLFHHYQSQPCSQHCQQLLWHRSPQPVCQWWWPLWCQWRPPRLWRYRSVPKAASSPPSVLWRQVEYYQSGLLYNPTHAPLSKSGLFICFTTECILAYQYMTGQAGLLTLSLSIGKCQFFLYMWAPSILFIQRNWIKDVPFDMSLMNCWKADMTQYELIYTLSFHLYFPTVMHNCFRLFPLEHVLCIPDCAVLCDLTVAV